MVRDEVLGEKVLYLHRFLEREPRKERNQLNLDMVKALIEIANVPTDEVNFYGETILHLALKKNYFDGMIEYLINYSDLQAVAFNKTAFNLAYEKQKFHLLQRLSQGTNQLKNLFEEKAAKWQQIKNYNHYAISNERIAIDSHILQAEQGDYNLNSYLWQWQTHT